MIWHFFEVWFLFLVVFTAGCGLGTALYTGLAQGPLATLQGSVADAVGDAIDAIKWRLGLAPDWRPGFSAQGEWPARDPVRQEPDEDEILRPATPAPSWADEPAQLREAWEDEPDLVDNLQPVEDAIGEGDRVEPDAGQPDAAPGEEEPTEELPMMRPAVLAEPRSGVPDNLQRIWGIGKRNEELLQSLGIFHFGQIAAWTPAEARWVASHLAFPERLERDNWIGQAIVLATGGDPSQVSPTNKKTDAGSEDEA